MSKTLEYVEIAKVAANFQLLICLTLTLPKNASSEKG